MFFGRGGSVFKRHFFIMGGMGLRPVAYAFAYAYAYLFGDSVVGNKGELCCLGGEGVFYARDWHGILITSRFWYAMNTSSDISTRVSPKWVPPPD